MDSRSRLSPAILVRLLGGENTQTMTLASLNFLGSKSAVYGQLAASIMVGIVPILVLALYAQWFLVRGLSMGAVKG